MNVTDNMLLIMQSLATQTTQAAKNTEPAAPGTKEDDRFDDVLQQHSSRKPAPDRAKAPDRPAEADDTDPAELSTAAQEAGAAVAAQTFEIVPVDVVSQGSGVVTVATDVLANTAAQTVAGQTETRPQLPQQQAKGDASQLPQTASEAPEITPATVQQTPVEATQNTNPEQLTKSATASENGIEQVELKQPEEAPAQPLFRQLEGTPIKVGEAPPTDTTAPDFEQQLAKQVDTALLQGEERLQIRLAPEHLGTLTLELTRAQDGSLRVLLQASTEKAATLLSEHAAGLGSLLRSSTQVPVQVEVQQENPQQQQDREASQQGHPQNQQQQSQQQNEQDQAQDFLQQLRLGIVPLWSETTDMKGA